MFFSEKIFVKKYNVEKRNFLKEIELWTGKYNEKLFIREGIIIYEEVC